MKAVRLQEAGGDTCWQKDFLLGGGCICKQTWSCFSLGLCRVCLKRQAGSSVRCLLSSFRGTFLLASGELCVESPECGFVFPCPEVSTCPAEDCAGPCRAGALSVCLSGTLRGLGCSPLGHRRWPGDTKSSWKAVGSSALPRASPWLWL